MKKWQLPLFVLLYLALIAMAINVSVMRHETHRLFTELRQLEKERDTLNSAWARLRLEQSTLLNRIHVGTQARQKLNMVMPEPTEIRVIEE